MINKIVSAIFFTFGILALSLICLFPSVKFLSLIVLVLIFATMCFVGAYVVFRGK